MLGWEYPPFNSGGLGIACHWLIKYLSPKHEIIFVLPKRLKINFPFGKLIFAEDYLASKFPDEPGSPYDSLRPFNFQSGGSNLSLYEQVFLYSQAIKNICQQFRFDLIHAHDWLTYPAGIIAKNLSKKPLIIHVHSTEFDRTGGNFVNSIVYNIEQNGFKTADKIIAVSAFTKNKILQHYSHTLNEKIAVVHNGIEVASRDFERDLTFRKTIGKKIVIFVGRLTIQKGPDYFLKAAKKVLDYYQDVVFIIAGSGDMQNFLIEQAASLNIADKVIFSGFLRDRYLQTLYQNADLFVMPSVSEPFGIASLEAMINKTPVLISKQSGVNEVIRHALKVDFWDIDEMANKILAVLNYTPLKETLSKEGCREALKINWDLAAQKVHNIYLQFAPA
jgi:glycosyltransferase involved in cell wall biosynthesis